MPTLFNCFFSQFPADTQVGYAEAPVFVLNQLPVASREQ